jgi:hypothetical protein
MASKKKTVNRAKKTVKRRGSDRRRKAKTAFTLSERAKAEVATLLERNQAGTMNPGDLETGLQEVDQTLVRLLGMIRHLL